MSEAPYDNSWIQFGDQLGRSYDHLGNPTRDWTWARPWWRKLLFLPAKRESTVRPWWE